MKIVREIGPATLGSSSTTDSPSDCIDSKEILAIGMELIADDFPPFDVSVNCSGDSVALPLLTGEIVEVSLSHGIQWERRFGVQHDTSVLYLFSLNLVGKLLSTFQKRNDTDALRLAVVAIESFLDYSSRLSNQTAIGTFVPQIIQRQPG